jgi:hypothetical protein
MCGVSAGIKFVGGCLKLTAGCVTVAECVPNTDACAVGCIWPLTIVYVQTPAGYALSAGVETWTDSQNQDSDFHVCPQDGGTYASTITRDGDGYWTYKSYDYNIGQYVYFKTIMATWDCPPEGGNDVWAFHHADDGTTTYVFIQACYATGAAPTIPPLPTTLQVDLASLQLQTPNLSTALPLYPVWDGKLSYTGTPYFWEPRQGLFPYSVSYQQIDRTYINLYAGTGPRISFTAYYGIAPPSLVCQLNLDFFGFIGKNTGCPTIMGKMGLYVGNIGGGTWKASKYVTIAPG